MNAKTIRFVAAVVVGAAVGIVNTVACRGTEVLFPGVLVGVVLASVTCIR